jgi:hypothetical protein
VVKTAVNAGTIPHCQACGTGVVKPDIVFFGESLPKRYFDLSHADLPQADLLLVFGTSLKVQPFASLVRDVVDECPRVLINRERVGEAVPFGSDDDFQFQRSGGFVFDGPTAYRDVFVEGDVQQSVLKLAELCGWKDDLQRLMQAWDAANTRDPATATTSEPAEKAAPAPPPASTQTPSVTVTVTDPSSSPAPVTVASSAAPTSVATAPSERPNNDE